MTGILIVDKPAGLSSAAIVTRVKRLLPRDTRIGHAGTLDPFATGVLVLLIGKATRRAEEVMGQPKQYEATVKLGATTETLDLESPEIAAVPVQLPTIEMIAAVLPQFVGQIEQTPPAYSALKIAGRPAYKMARKGQSPDLKPRLVHVYDIQMKSYQWPLLDLKIDCGRGTYIRALARDIGQALGTNGYLTALRRTRVGAYTAEDAVSLETLAERGVEVLLHE